MTTPRTSPAAAARVHLLPLHAGHQQAFLTAVHASQALHRPWVSPPATPEQFVAYAERMQAPGNCGLLVVQQGAASLELAGVVNITNVVMGPVCSGYLGYYAFAGYERQGLMREGLTVAVRQAFRTVKMHGLVH